MPSRKKIREVFYGVRMKNQVEESYDVLMWEDEDRLTLYAHRSDADSVGFQQVGEGDYDVIRVVVEWQPLKPRKRAEYF